jgi:hypothetical protein
LVFQGTELEVLSEAHGLRKIPGKHGRILKRIRILEDRKMTKRNAMNGIFFTAVIISMIFAFSIQADAADDGQWSWYDDRVTIEATAYNYPGGGVTVNFYAKNENDYKIRIHKFNATVYIGGRNYSDRLIGNYVDAHKRAYLGAIYAHWEGREKVSNVTIQGIIDVERLD